MGCDFSLNLTDPLVARACARSDRPDSEISKRKRAWEEARLERIKIERFISTRWWCAPTPIAHGGIWWQDIIDRKTGQVWFWNKGAGYIRPWKDGDENIRQRYVETNAVWNIRPIRLPSSRKVARYLEKLGRQCERQCERWLYPIFALTLANWSIKTKYRDVMDYVRWHGQKDFFAVAAQFNGQTEMIPLKLSG